MSLDPLALRSLIQQWRELGLGESTGDSDTTFNWCANELEAVLARSGEPSDLMQAAQGALNFLTTIEGHTEGPYSWDQTVSDLRYAIQEAKGAASQEPRS
jgi:hypothetical protein